MDLKTFLFQNRISPLAFAAVVDIPIRMLWRVIVREIRPRSNRAYVIEAVTGGVVTVDELINPIKYPVEWGGDLAKEYRRRILLQPPAVFQIREAICRMNELVKSIGKTKGRKMDKKIKAISKGVKQTEKKLTSLLKEDQKRDPACHLGEKILAKKKRSK